MVGRIGVLQFFHEASCIAPRLVTRDEFLARHHLKGPDVARQFGATNNWMGGVLAGLSARGITPQIGLCTAALPGGPVVAQDFEHLLTELETSLSEMVQAGPLSHLFLLLHGALLVDGQTDPEGRIAQRMRALTGPQTRICVPLDFHANPGPGLLDAADIILGGKLYPHTDTRARGARLVDLGLGAAALQTTHHPLGLQVPMARQYTTHGPFGALADLSDQLEGGAIADVTLLGGFPFSNAPFRGTSLLITAAPDCDRAPIVAQMHAALAPHRVRLQAALPGFAQARAEIMAGLSQGRVVLADTGDNPGGGAPGDQTAMIPFLLSLGVRFGFGFLVAPGLVAQAQAAGCGGTVTIDTPAGGVQATVCALAPVMYQNRGSMMTGETLNGGPGAVLGLGGSRVLVSSLRVQAYDPAAFSAMGVDIEPLDLLAVKSIAHFRAGYTPLATGGVITVDGGGLSSARRAPPYKMGAAR